LQQKESRKKEHCSLRTSTPIKIRKKVERKKTFLESHHTTRVATAATPAAIKNEDEERELAPVRAAKQGL
jgi:hypothetical protein